MARLVMVWRTVLGVLGVVALAGCMGPTGSVGPNSGGALPNPPDNGGLSISDAIRTNGSGWIRGFLVARKGEPVRLCTTLGAANASGEPSCDGASLELADHVLWRLPDNQTVYGGVINGVLTNSLDDPENPNDAQPCSFGLTPGPCASFPYLHSSASVIWSEHAYSAIGKVSGHTLTELRELAP